MKKYNVVSKKDNILLLSFITYDKKLEKTFVNQFKKIKQVNLIEVSTCEKKT